MVQSKGIILFDTFGVVVDGKMYIVGNDKFISSTCAASPRCKHKLITDLKTYLYVPIEHIANIS